MADLTHMGLLGAVVVGVGCAAGCAGERPEFGPLRGASDAASNSLSNDSSIQDTSSHSSDASKVSPSVDSDAGTTVSNETTDEASVGGDESDAGGQETTEKSDASSGVDDEAGGSTAEEHDGDGGSATNETTCTKAMGACTGCDPCTEQDSSVGPYCGDGTVSDGEACDVSATWCHECQVVPAITAGASHTCALLANGGVKCWGQGGSGQLGNADTSAQLAPVDVIGLSSTVSAIAAGGGHTCALLANDGVKCWGEGGVGQLGNNDTSSQPTPVDVVELGSSVSAIAGGYSHTCAVLANGGVKCWGQGSSGQLGNNDINNQPTPVDVIGLSSGVSAIAAGAHHTCALLASGGVKCWGYGANGELGNDDISEQPTPVDVTNLGSKVSAIAAGSSHTCALLASGSVKCWGSNARGQIGNSALMRQTSAQPFDVRLR